MTAKNLKIVDQIREKSLLKGVALQVYEIIANSNGLTVGEITWKYAGSGDDDTALGRSRNELAKRVSDLVNLGAVKAYGRVLCPFTGRKANRYVVTGMLPERAKVAPELSQSPFIAPALLSPAVTEALQLAALKDALLTLEGAWFIRSKTRKAVTSAIHNIDSLLKG